MKDPPIPPTLPWDQWRKDKEGRTMTRQCRYCGQSHYDMDCKKHPESYHITMSLDQWPPQDGPQVTLNSGSDSDESSNPSSSSTSYINQVRIMAVYSNGQHAISTQTDVKIPRAERYRIVDVILLE